MKGFCFLGFLGRKYEKLKSFSEYLLVYYIFLIILEVRIFYNIKVKEMMVNVY